MSKEDRIVEYLKGLVRNGTLKPGGKVPSEYELADMFEVSKLTANKAVTRLVGLGWFKRLRGAAGTVLEERIAGRKGMIAYRTTLLSGYSYSVKMFQGAGRAARLRGYLLLYYENDVPEKNLWNELLSAGVDGVIATAAGSEPEGYPLPVIDAGNIYSANHVLSDDYAGSVLMAEYLIRMGHKHPVMLIENEKDLAGRPRVRGIIDTYTKAGMPEILEHTVLDGGFADFSPGNIYKAVVKSDPECSVVICNSDTTALMLIQYLESHGIAVPEKISVTGFGNQLGHQTIRHIATVNQYPEEIGFAACSYLIDIIEGIRTAPVRELSCIDFLPGNTIGKC